MLSIPLSQVQSRQGGVLIARPEGDLLLLTDPRSWAYSAAAQFELPANEGAARLIGVGVQVEEGRLGIGWLSEDETAWVRHVPVQAGPRAVTVNLEIAAGTIGGKLVFDNQRAEGGRTRAVINGITVSRPADDEFRLALTAEENGETAASIAHYKEALRINAAHVGARAGLGRLRYIAPAQPLLDEWKRRSPPVDLTEVVITVRNPCNYRCFYCIGAGYNNTPVQPFDFKKIRTQYDHIDTKMVATSLECGGGEPTVHPEFKALLSLCGAYGSVTFPTNNSQNPKRWLPSEVAKALGIRGALHPEAEPKLVRFIDNARLLIEAGCNFRCDFISHPSRLHLLAKYRDVFAKEGIPFLAVPFIGTYNGKSYPQSYSEDEQRLLADHSVEDKAWHSIVRISSHVNRIRNFRGIPCLAGYRHIKITSDGKIRRCIYDDEPLEKPLTAPTPCRVPWCGCGLFLERLNFSHTYFNAEPHNLVELARSLGYEDSSVGLATEYVGIYDNLMAAYGKDEYPE